MELDIRKIKSAFYNANQAVNDHYPVTYSISEHKKQFKEMHGCEIVVGESWGNWQTLVFETEEDATMFLLEWS